MKVIYGIGRWTNASRPQARHIAGEDGRPLCGDKRRKHVSSYEIDETGEITCVACVNKWRANK